MLSGFSGHLLSETYLETVLVRSPRTGLEQRAIERAHRELVSWRRRSSSLGPSSSLRAMLNAGAEPLAAALGFGAAGRLLARDRTVAATFQGPTRGMAWLIASWGEPLDPLWREAVTDAIERQAPWCIVFNGTHLRIVDAGRLFARRYAEFELDHALDDLSSFLVLWAVLNARTSIEPGQDGVRTPLHDLIDASDRHAAGVCRSLKDGVLAASADILAALSEPKRRSYSRLDDVFEQALTIVYRMVFLLFAEARALVPVWHPVYRESYSLDTLREAAEQPHGARGLWEALRAITRLAHAGCYAGDLRVTPFNGRLFAPARTPLADRKNLDDEAARRAVLALSTRPSADHAGRDRIAYRDLGVEQLGAVYETLLDYAPHTEAAAPSRRRSPKTVVTLRTGSGIRKATGTFYTPQPIAEYLVRRTLGPLVHDAEPERILQLRIVDPAMGSGAFLVAACRYLAGAYEVALVRSGGCHASDIGARERANIRRTVAERCLYGVDLNPMAVQLARLSVWLTTLAADRPLSFLDHRLRAGNSLLGAWLAALSRTPDRRRRRGRHDRDPLLFEDLHVRDALGEALPVRFSLESLPNDTVDHVRAKEQAFAAMTAPGSALGQWGRVADLWCATWLATDRQSLPSEAFEALADSILTGRRGLSPDATRQYLQVAAEIASGRRLFHWELEFPEVFFDADGTRRANAGFDAVLGNPPWDMIRAGGNTVDPDAGRVLRFTRDSGTYGAQSDGHANSYQLFLERAVALTRADGRVGLVLPAGFATDRGSRSLRRLLLTRCNVDALVGFDNHRGIFPIHRGFRFLLTTATAGRATNTIACRFGVDNPADLESVGDQAAAAMAWFPVRLSAPLLTRLSGDDLTIPWLLSPMDLAIAERATALFPPLGSTRGWSARFGRELNATDNKAAFRGPDDGLPVVDGRQLEPFGVQIASSRRSVRARDARQLLPDGRYRRARLAYRDVASATNRLTLIAAILPAGCVSTHTVFCLRTRLAVVHQHLLCGLFNSFVVNYLVRMQVSMHVTTATVEQLPIPVIERVAGAAREIAVLARLLSRRRDQIAYARLQALVAALYQLSADEFAHVLSTFPLVPRDERDAALATFVAEMWSA